MGRGGIPFLICALLAAAAAAGCPGARAAAPPTEIRQGDRLFNRGELRAAFDRYLAAYRQGQAAGDRLLMGEALTDMAAVYQELGDGAGFRRAFDQAQEMKRSHAEARPDLVPIADPRAAGNILANGGFEAGLFYPWGLGHFEREDGRFKFGIWWNSNNARAYMKTDSDVRHAGQRSLRITNLSPAAPHVFTTTSQRIEGLAPNSVVRVSMMVRARDLAPGAVFFAVDAGWTKLLPALQPGTYDWQPYGATINIGHNDYIDFRIIHQSIGTAWIDEVAIERLAGGEAADPLQRAESLYDLARYDEALEIARRIEREQPKADGLRLAVRRLAGRIHMTRGDYDDALASFDWLLGRGWPRAHWDLGDLHADLGRHLEAIVHYEKALDAVKGDQSSESLVLSRLGAARMAQSRLTAPGPQADALIAGARKALERALLIVRHIGDRHGEAETLIGLGALRREQGDLEGAVELLALAARVLSGLDDRRLFSDALLRLGEASLSKGDAAAAARFAGEARAVKAAIGDGLGLVQALSLLGRVRIAEGDGHGARALLADAIDRLEALYDSLATAPRETRRVFLSQFQDLYRRYIGLLFELYDQGRDPRLHQAAFEAGEQVRSRLFTEMVAETRAASALEAGSADPAFSALLRREREGQVRLQALRATLARPRAPGAGAASAAAAIREEIGAAERDYAAALRELERGYPRYFELKRPGRLGLAEVQRLLDDDEAVLSYLVTERATGVWAITRRAVSFAVLPLGQRELARATVDFSGSFAEIVRRFARLSSPDYAAFAEVFGLYDPAVAHRLYRALVQPVAAALKGRRLVYLAPDDVLYKLPFDALLTAPPKPREAGAKPVIAGDLGAAPFLLREASLVYLPSIAVLRTLRTLPKQAGSRTRPFLAFADPVFEEEVGDEGSAKAVVRGILMQRLRAAGSLRGRGLVRLPDTREEALAIAGVLGVEPEGALYLGREAAERNVKRLPLADYRYLLFATHGLLAGEFGPGLQPALALSFVGDPENDGLLEMGEILGLDLAADLVALSACNTAGGSGEDDRGEGFAGLTRSFMYAGARALLVTQWPVETTTARRFMVQVFEGAREAGASRALDAAKRAFLDRPTTLPLADGIAVSTAHPFFWAPFILVGEGR